jgi:hypothetical protein
MNKKDQFHARAIDILAAITKGGDFSRQHDTELRQN